MTGPLETQPIELAFAVNQKMAMPLGVVLEGVLRHLNPASRAQLHVLADGLSSDARDRLTRVVHGHGRRHAIDFLDTSSERIDALPEVRHLSRATYLRLLLPELLPDVGRVLYLDADLLVGRDVEELYRIDLAGFPVGAVASLWGETLDDPRAIPYCTADDCVPADAPLFNAGVLLMDLDAWRRDDLAARMISFLERYADRLVCADQDAINAVLAHRIAILSPHWNLVAASPHYLARIPDAALRDQVAAWLAEPNAPVIMHYVGRHKPWGDDAFRHAHASRYAAALRRSGYFSRAECALWRVGWFARNARHIVAGTVKRAVC
ncbi:MAG: glycosyltransferase family 8 protein [Planctomycetota bacterium]